MKSRTFLIFTIMSLATTATFASTLGNTAIPEVINIVFEDLPQTDFIKAEIFEKVSYTFLETNNSCLLGNGLRVQTAFGEYYVFDEQQKRLFRFDARGRFLNSIGSEGKGPKEYVRLIDYAVDAQRKRINLLVNCSSSNGTIFSYTPDGVWSDSVKLNTPAVSMAIIGDRYIISTSYDRTSSKEGRLYMTDTKGKILAKFLPITTPYPPVVESNFSYSSNGNVLFFELFCDTVYRITSDTVNPVYSFDFGALSLPADFHSSKEDWVIRIQKVFNHGMRLILSCCENNHFFYCCIMHQQSRKDQPVYYHAILDKISGHAQLLKASNQSYIQASLINNNDELVFIIHPDEILEMAKQNPMFKPNMPVKEEMNPLVTRIKLKRF